MVKGVEGWIVAAIGFRRPPPRQVAGLAAGILVLVGGYYLFEALAYPLLAEAIPFFGVTDPRAALAEIFPNLVQGAISAVLAFGIQRVFNRPSGGLD